jgi:hypothetical protein
VIKAEEDRQRFVADLETRGEQRLLGACPRPESFTVELDGFLLAQRNKMINFVANLCWN